MDKALSSKDFQLGEPVLRVLYKAQRDILACGKDTDTLLGILGKAASELSGKKGIAVFFYDPSTKTARVRFNDGFENLFLNGISEKFANFCRKSLPIPTEVITETDGTRCLFIPLGKVESPFGLLVLPVVLDAVATGIEEFRQLATDSISNFMETELVKLRVEELATLLEVGKAISSTLELTDLLKKIMHMATQVMRCETSTVYLVDSKTHELYFHIVQGDSSVGARLQEIRLPMGTGLAGWCAKENKPVIVPDTSKDPRFFKGADKKSGFVTRSMICVPMRLKDDVIGVLQVLNRTGDISFNEHDIEMLEAIANLAVSALDNARLYQNIQKIYLSTVDVLATAIDAKDPYTHGHSRRVTEYSVAIAEAMGFDPKALDNVRYAGLLHDVGKIGIKDSIIGKPGKLTDEEYATIKKHPVIGAEILRPVEFLADKIPGVLHHHEYFDGRGYPDHLVGEMIPMIGRIICVADTFDAMTSDRPYRKGLDVNVAIAELKKFSGKQFDPKCVEAFLTAFEKKLFQTFEREHHLEAEARKMNAPLASGSSHGEKPQTLESQPYPPTFINDHPKLESQPYPPIHSDNQKENPECQSPKEKESLPSSQPYPPIGAI
ncbi:GAF domain-containing protein, partial [bacterium]|nr:GAF domain-containing protein [bacterium]